MRLRVFSLAAVARHRQEPTSRLMEHGKMFKSSNLTMSRAGSNSQAEKYGLTVSMMCIN